MEYVNLAQWPGTAWARLVNERRVVRICRDELSAPPARSRLGGMVALFGTHRYGNERSFDELHLTLNRVAARTFGLLLIARTLHGRPGEMSVRIGSATTPAGAIMSIERPLDVANSRHRCATYVPAKLSRHPWRGQPSRPGDMVSVALDVAANSVLAVRWVGTRSAYRRLGALFLDISAPGGDVDEIALESSMGFGGVGRSSAEIHIWRPRGLGAFRAARRT